MGRTLLVVLGVALVAVGIGIAAWQWGADAAFELGLVAPTSPYPTRFPAEELGQVGKLSPTGNRVVIPKIRADVQVRGGEDAEAALSRGAYHVAGTPAPGADGNTVFAGHRNLRVFSLLHKLRRGDPVVVFWKGVEHDYRVERVFAVPADGTQILAPSASEKLTLYTCEPRFMGDTRTVVVATPVDLGGE